MHCWIQEMDNVFSPLFHLAISFNKHKTFLFFFIILLFPTTHSFWLKCNKPFSIQIYSVFLCINITFYVHIENGILDNITTDKKSCQRYYISILNLNLGRYWLLLSPCQQSIINMIYSAFYFLEEAGIGMCKQRSGSTYFLTQQRCKSRWHCHFIESLGHSHLPLHMNMPGLSRII